MELKLAKKSVGVMGSGSDDHHQLAMEVGDLLARLQVNLITGGGKGVMSSVSRAFTQSKSRSVGICIGIIPCEKDKPSTDKSGYPNPYVELPIRTHLHKSGLEGSDNLSRNHINVLSSVAIVALPGGDGTSSEIALAVKYGRPVIAYAGEKLDLLSKFPKEIRCAATIQQVEEFLRPLVS